MVSARTWTLASLAVLSALGCQDLLDLTPGRLDPAGGSGGTGSGAGGSGGSSTSSLSTAGGGGSTSSGGGGAGGCDVPCTADRLCEEAACVGGVCVVTPSPRGTPAGDPVPGDCKASACDGAGSLMDVPSFDPDDGNECTFDACAGGVAGHLPKLDGTLCAGGAGICESGLCTPAVCAVPDGVQNGHETGIDCGGVCPPCTAGAGCRVAADCKTGFCASGACAEPPLLAMIVKSTAIAFGAFDPGTSSEWTVLPQMGDISGLTAAGIAFDAAGEAVAIARDGSSGGRASRWKSGAWTAPKLWSLGSTGWVPAFARTDAALYVFAQDSNFKHRFSVAMGDTGDPFQAIGDTTSHFSGGAGVRQGHASFFFAPTAAAGSLVERRLVGGAWSEATVLLTGDYTDCQPAVVPVSSGTLLVAARRFGDEHAFDWLLLGEEGPVKSGTIEGTTYGVNNAVPRRVALAPLDDGGAILAFRGPTGLLDVRVASVDGASVTWSPQNIYPSPTGIAAEPALARGLSGAKAELVWIAQGGTFLRHARWLADGTWSPPVDILNTGAGSIAIARP